MIALFILTILVSLESAIFKPPPHPQIHPHMKECEEGTSTLANKLSMSGSESAAPLERRDDLKSRTCLQSLLSITTTAVGSRTTFEPHVHASDPLKTHLTSLSWQVLVFTDGSGWAVLGGDASTHHQVVTHRGQSASLLQLNMPTWKQDRRHSPR